MLFLRTNTRIISILLVFSGLVIFFTTCISKQAKDLQPAIALPNGNRLVGNDACQRCHADIYKNYLATAHQKTSAPANKQSILGSFEENKNSFVFNAQDGVVMVANDSGFFQSNFINRKLEKPYPFDIVIGSGTRGQSYLFWNGNNLFQLPISYFTATNSWANSPGFPQDYALFTRPINSSCLNCHHTYIKQLSNPTDQLELFDHNPMVYGISCERCHGAGGKHVDFHIDNPNEKLGKFIVNTAHMQQDQQLLACAACHSGLKPAKTVPTDLSQNDSIITPDVHGNQFGLLLKSKCFREAGTITCSTCHNTHNQERGNLALFSQRCVSCHAPDKAHFCKMAGQISNQNLISNCIDCHMPTRESKILDVQVFGEAKHLPAVLRTHQIGIYPDDAKKFMQFIKK
jgi:Cytochrome c554 and c-prime